MCQGKSTTMKYEHRKEGGAWNRWRVESYLQTFFVSGRYSLESAKENVKNATARSGVESAFQQFSIRR